MPNKTKIPWTNFSSNPIVAYTATGARGHACYAASPGCANCYAERLNLRWGTKLRFAKQELRNIEFRLNEQELEDLVKLNDRLAKKNERAYVFPCDMCDLFLPEIPRWMLDRVFETMYRCANLTFQCLTKRAEGRRRIKRISNDMNARRWE